MALHSDLPDGQAPIPALSVSGWIYFNEFMQCPMSFFSAIEAFKGAFLGALLGNHLGHAKAEPAMPLRPDPAMPSRPEPASPCHHPHSTRPEFAHAHPAKPVHGTPYPFPAHGHQYSVTTTYPLFR